MAKIITQAALLVGLFFATWYGLQEINWMKLFRIEQLTQTTEEKIGDLLYDMIDRTETVVTEPDAINALDSIIQKIISANNLDTTEIKLHLIKKDEVNAFALPAGHMVIYTGLITGCDKQEELIGVICHELAHMKKNHVMKKLVKEIGLSVLVSMTGNGGGEIMRQALKILSSTAYDRTLEREADRTAVDYMLKAGVDPEPFADFMYKLSTENGDIEEHLSWVSTHPESKERAESILGYCKGKIKKRIPILSEESWKNLQLLSE
jgi:predicted Zn-dependent protease